MNKTTLYNLCYNTVLDLASEDGINASSRTEAYGCIFGRDTAITVLKLLNVVEKNQDAELLAICKRGLQSLLKLQGKEFNLESGEEPGKCIHEYRPDKYDHLINRDKPWYVYPDKKLRNYDSIDATPLLLIAIHKYWQVSQDSDFLLHSLSGVEAGLQWIMNSGDKDHDYLIEYTLPVERSHGGLTVQSWTDSADCLQRPDGTFPLYPIAAVEVQSMAWLSLKLWSEFYEQHSPSFAQELRQFAFQMKKVFNEKFVIKDKEKFFLAQALDGHKQQISTITANPLLCLWASYKNGTEIESIVDHAIIPDLVSRAFEQDLFEPGAGLRTMSTLSPTFKPLADSYHNGSFWPMQNGMVYEGLKLWGYHHPAEQVRQATLASLHHFGSAIELFIKTPTGEFTEYVSPRGKKGCRHQAWTAAAALEMLAV